MPVDSSFDALVAEAVRGAGDPAALQAAQRRAVSARERQVAAIAAAFLAGDHERVDGLAREHLVDHPDSVVVAEIAATNYQRRGIPAPPEGPPS